MSYKGYQWFVAYRHALANSKVTITPLNLPSSVLIDLFFIKKVAYRLLYLELSMIIYALGIILRSE